MRKIFAFILLGFIFSTSKGFSGCGFGFSGEWLYMLSAYDQPYYAIDVETGATLFNGDRVANSQEWHSGYRLEASYRYGPCDTVRARWTSFSHFSNSDTDDENNNGILVFPSPISNFTFSTIKDEFDLYLLEILYQRSFCCTKPFSIGLDIGVEFAHFDVQEISKNSVIIQILDDQVLYIANDDNQAQLRGIGPELGFHFDYSFFRCLNLRGRGSSSLLISKKWTKAREIAGFQDPVFGSPTLTYTTGNEKYWVATPSLNARLGLNYDQRLSCGRFCGKFNLEIGYEIIHLMKGFDRIYFVEDDAQSITQTMDFTLHGPYAHLGLCF